MFGALPLIVLTHTWDWRLTCYPNIPNCLADDLYAFVETYMYLIPDCFCTYFPSLVGECVDTFCHFVSGSTTFAQCPDVIPEFGYLWVSFFYAKHYTPDLLRFAHYFLYQSEAFNTWMLTIDKHVVITQTSMPIMMPTMMPTLAMSSAVSISVSVSDSDSDSVSDSISIATCSGVLHISHVVRWDTASHSCKHSWCT